MLTTRRFLLPSALAALLVIAGCNVLDPAYDEGGDVQALLEDARYARANGDFDRAAELLEEAYAQEPANPEVRLELAGTLLQREGLNSIDLVSQVVHFVEEHDAGAGGQRSDGEACTWESAEPAQPFDPASFPEYGTILEARPVLNQVRDLLAGTDGAILPAELLTLSPCEAIVDGEVVYDREVILDDLYATFDQNQNRVRTALLLNTVTLVLNAYVGVFEQPDLPVSWFIVGEGESERLGYCVAPEQALTLQNRIDGEVSNVGRAMFSLDLLVHDANNAALAALRDEALALYEAMEADLNPLCD